MMTVQRQYSLPNCVLILEGFNPEIDNSPRPLLSVLTSFECHFANEAQIIKGGRDLLNALAHLVHGQAQSILSGLSLTSTDSQPDSSEAIQLNSPHIGQFSLRIPHQLLQESPNTADASDAEAIVEPANTDKTQALDIQLNSVQLFDLVEALDQLMEDSQTLPDLSLQLKPLSRREAKVLGGPSQVTKSAPLLLGILGLAVAGAISFVIPVPEITKPSAPESTEDVTETTPTETLPAETSEPGAAEQAPSPSPEDEEAELQAPSEDAPPSSSSE